MADEFKIQNLDFGTALELTVNDSNGVVNLGSANVLNMILQAPDAISIAKTAVLTSDGSDGKMKYIVESGVIQTIGTWRLQGEVGFPNGSGNWKTDIVSFMVHANL